LISTAQAERPNDGKLRPIPLVDIVEADLSCVKHQTAIVELVNAYAMDAMGNGQPLPAEVRGALIPGLQNHPTTIVFLAYREGQPVGIAVCFRGFSTFAARPLINIHDLAILPEFRGQKIGPKLWWPSRRKPATRAAAS